MECIGPNWMCLYKGTIRLPNDRVPFVTIVWLLICTCDPPSPLWLLTHTYGWFYLIYIPTTWLNCWQITLLPYAWTYSYLLIFVSVSVYVYVYVYVYVSISVSVSVSVSLCYHEEMPKLVDFFTRLTVVCLVASKVQFNQSCQCHTWTMFWPWGNHISSCPLAVYCLEWAHICLMDKVRCNGELCISSSGSHLKSSSLVSYHTWHSTVPDPTHFSGQY